MRRFRTESLREGVVALLLVPLLILAGCSGPDTAGTPQAVGVTVFEGARLIVGDGRPTMVDASFVVEDDRITQVGPRGQLNVPAGAARVDLSGRTVMPALIDTHKHLSGSRDAIIDELQHFAYYGIGTVMSLGTDDGDLPFQMRNETLRDAAHFFTAGRGITTPEPGRSEVPYWVTSEAEARAAVRELADRNVEWVKIWVDDRNGAYEKLGPELYGAVIDEAHQHGLRVTAHIFELEDAKGLLRAGVDAFAHGVRDQDIDEEGVALFRERPNVFVVPNLPNRGVAAEWSWLAGTVPADELRALQETSTEQPAAQATFGIQARNLVRLNQEGVRIAFGTDGGVPWAAHLELEDMVAAGMTPAEVIVAATQTSAELLNLTDVGTIEPGKRADFIVLEADPLEDITNTRRIAAVYLRGMEVDRPALSARWTGTAAQ